MRISKIRLPQFHIFKQKKIAVKHPEEIRLGVKEFVNTQKYYNKNSNELIKEVKTYRTPIYQGKTVCAYNEEQYVTINPQHYPFIYNIGRINGFIITTNGLNEKKHVSAHFNEKPICGMPFIDGAKEINNYFTNLRYMNIK
ncbi:MAG: hypothetical protein MJ237_08005 [bacterium]|nr:hypothetical protein [bacterium]